LDNAKTLKLVQGLFVLLARHFGFAGLGGGCFCVMTCLLRFELGITT